MLTKSYLKIIFIFIAIAIIILLIGTYYVYSDSNKNISPSSISDTPSSTSSSSSSSSSSDNSSDSDDDENSQTRDPNRFYNEKGNYSFIIPEDMKVRIPSDYSDSIDERITEIASEFPVPIGDASGWLPFAHISFSDPSGIDPEFNCKNIEIDIKTFRECITYSEPAEGDWYIYHYLDSSEEKEKLFISGADKNVIDQILQTIELE